MPQIQAADYARLQRFCAERNVTVAMPLLVSSDSFVLDGNHRLAEHLQAHSRTVHVLRLGLEFLPAVRLLFAFPGVSEEQAQP